MATETHVGLVGIGRIGRRLRDLLLDAGYPLTVYDVDETKVADSVAEGAEAAGDPAAVARAADLVVLSLPGNRYVEAAMDGEDGVLAGLEGGELVVDTGTTSPDVEVYYEAACEDRGAAYMEAPLTFGGPGERDPDGAPFTMFVGGKREYYERARPVIETVSRQHEYFGTIGCGQVMKAGHRMRQNLRAAVDAEMTEFLRNNGVDPERAAEFMEWHLHERFTAERYPRTAGFRDAVAEDDPDTDSLADNSYRVETGGSRPRLRQSEWVKDQSYALSIAHSSNTATPLLSTMYQMLLAAENYASALSERELQFGDPDGWEGRPDSILHYRRLNRPREEWERLARPGERDPDAESAGDGDGV